MIHSSRNPLLSVKWLTSPDRKSAQTEWRQNRSSSLSIFIFLETFHRFPPWFDYSWLSQTIFSDSARNLGVILDSNLSVKKNVIKVCQTAYFELKRISSIRRFLTEDAAKTLVTSYILSRLDYCNCLLMGTPNSVIQPLQKIQNFAARLVLLAPRHQHSAPLLEKNSTGFPFQNVLNIKSPVCVSVL